MSPSIKNVFCLLFLHEHLSSSVQTDWNVRTIKLILTHVRNSMICDITTLELTAVQYATHTSVMCKRETSFARTLRINFTVKQQPSCL